MATLTTEPGSVIAGRYRVVRTLGTGGMGTVVLAEQTDLERRVALKILTAELAGDATVVERLRREARAAASLSHPNVAQVYALEETSDGVVALAMELVEGKSLREILRVDGRLDTTRAVRIARQMLQGLAAAHAAGIVHRDVKPENVLVTTDERRRDQVKLVDFGIAKKLGSSKLTERGMVIGTPSYLAPEQIRGEEADARSDLWSVGIVMFEMIAGERPFHGEETRALLKAIMTDAPPLLSDKVGAPSHISAAVDRALRKDASARFSSAKEMLAALDAPREEDAPSTKKERPAARAVNDRAQGPPTAGRPLDRATEGSEGRAQATGDRKQETLSPTAPSASREGSPVLIGLGVLAVAAGVSIYFRYGDASVAGVDAGIVFGVSSNPIASAVVFAEAAPIPDYVMTIGESSDVDIDPIATRAEDVARCLGKDRTCVTLTHARGAIVLAVPEEDDDAGQCIVAALEGSRLDENARPTVRVCITRTSR